MDYVDEDEGNAVLAAWERELLGIKEIHCGLDLPHAGHDWVNHPRKLTDGTGGNWCEGTWVFQNAAQVDSFLQSK